MLLYCNLPTKRVRSPATTTIYSPSTLCAPHIAWLKWGTRSLEHGLYPFLTCTECHMCNAIVWLLERQTCRRRSSASNCLLKQNVMLFEWRKCELWILPSKSFIIAIIQSGIECVSSASAPVQSCKISDAIDVEKRKKQSSRKQLENLGFERLTWCVRTAHDEPLSQTKPITIAINFKVIASLTL